MDDFDDDLNAMDREYETMQRETYATPTSHAKAIILGVAIGAVFIIGVAMLIVRMVP